jgi:hypothetical protein
LNCKISKLKTKKAEYDFIKIGLKLPQEELTKKIEKRVEEKRIKDEDEKERIWKEKNNIQIEI